MCPPTRGVVCVWSRMLIKGDPLGRPYPGPLAKSYTVIKSPR